MKWFIVLVLIVALAFGLGLRIHPKALVDKLINRPDRNIAALVKMGINPDEVGYKTQPWWTFRPENNLFKRFHINLSFGGRSKMMLDTLTRARNLAQKSWGPGPGEVVADQAQQEATQARRTQSRVEDQIRNLPKQ